MGNIIFLSFFVLVLCNVQGSYSAWSCPNPGPPHIISENYTPLGKKSNTDIGLRIYEVGPPDGKSLLIGIHDIFGLDSPKNNFKQFADILSDGSYRVILPDFFDGKPWDMAHGIPDPTRNPAYVDWQNTNSWENSVRDKLAKILGYYKSRGVKGFGMFGLSYGGHKVALASGSPEFGTQFRVAARFTEAPVTLTDANLIQIPTLIVGAENSVADTSENYCREIEKNLGTGTCVYERFMNQHAGFLGSEGNWEIDAVRAEAEKAIASFQKFLCQHFVPFQNFYKSIQ